MDGTATTYTYGAHVSKDLFTKDGYRYSRLLELDGDLELYSLATIHDALGGMAFDAGYAKIEFGDEITYTPTKDGKAAKLDYVNTFYHTGVFDHTPNPEFPDITEEIEYSAPVSIYTDGTNYYAFVVEKQEIQSGYVAFMESYVLTDAGWAHSKSWYPSGDGLPVGAYKYDTAFSLGTVMTHFVMIGGEYLVDDGEGYYLTRYMPRYTDSMSGEYRDGGYVVGKGQTVMFLGDSENNDPTVALAFTVNYEEYVDFIYALDGKWVNSTGSEVKSAAEDYLGGAWFDGTKKYTFDVENGTVTADGKTVPYTLNNSVVSFTLTNKVELVLAPTTYGSYKLTPVNGGAALVMASYVSDAFDGAWITEKGDKLAIADGEVTFNDAAVEASDTVYNGVQAIAFTSGDKEYYLVNYREDGVTMLIQSATSAYAFNSGRLAEVFVGEYVSVSGGVRYELTIDEDLEVLFEPGNATAQMGAGNPYKTFIGDGSGRYGLTVTMGGTEYTVERAHDVVTLSYGDTTLAFTDTATFNRFVCEYTNGTETLKITENGTFVRYDNGTAQPSTFTDLTALYREERVEYGLDGRGFVLSYTEDEQEYFFYADIDAPNVFLYKSRLNSNGVLISDRINNFVPASALTDIYGTFVREYDNGLDTVTIAANSKIQREYPGYFGTTEEELCWYPLINYNKNTEATRTVLYTFESMDTATSVSLMEFNSMGMTWGINGYLSEDVYDAFKPYTQKVYASDNVSVAVGTSKLVVTTLTLTNGNYTQTTETYVYDDYVQDGTDVMLELVQTGLGVTDPKTASAYLSTDNGTCVLSLTIGDGAETEMEGQEPLDYNSLVGEYVDGNGTTYSFKVEESWFGTTISLKIGTRSYNYSESNGVVIMSNGAQALPVGSAYVGYKYIWKDGDSLMVADSYDASKALEATDAAIAGMPTVDELKTMLDGQTYKAADNSEISFEISSGILGDNFEITVGSGSEYLDDSSVKVEKGKYTLHFGDTFSTNDYYVIVYFNDDNAITKITVATTEGGAATEYLPTVTVPTVAELKTLLLTKAFKSADGSTITFYEEESLFGGTTYNITVDGQDYYDKVEESYANGVFTLKYRIGYNAPIELKIYYGASGIEKIMIGEKEYTEVVPPTIDELKTMLLDMTFKSADGSTITFEETTGFFGAYFINVDDDSYYYNKGASFADGVYTMPAEDSFNTVVCELKIYYGAGSIEKITIGDKEYFEVTE